MLLHRAWVQLAAKESVPAAPDYLLSFEDLQGALYEQYGVGYVQVWAIYTHPRRPGQREWLMATLFEMEQGEAMVEFEHDYREMSLPPHMIALRIGEYSDVPPELPPLEAPESNA